MTDPYKTDRWICATCGHDSSMEPHWKSRAEKAEARVKELEAQVEREVALGMEYATKVEELRKLCGEAAKDGEVYRLSSVVCHTQAPPCCGEGRDDVSDNQWQCRACGMTYGKDAAHDCRVCAAEARLKDLEKEVAFWKSKAKGCAWCNGNLEAQDHGEDCPVKRAQRLEVRNAKLEAVAEAARKCYLQGRFCGCVCCVALREALDALDGEDGTCPG